MTLDEWLALAVAESSTSLHAFNYEREQSYHPLPLLQSAYQAFADFLTPFPDDGIVSASGLLGLFAKSQPDLTRDLIDTRFADPGLEAECRQVFLKALGPLPSERLVALGFDPLALNHVSDEIAQMVRSSPAGQALSESEESYVQRLVQSLLPDPNTTADAEAHAHIVTASSPSPIVDPPEADFGSTPWWFTSERALEEVEGDLPDAANVLERSGYVAGLRALLGLEHWSDRQTESEVAATSGHRFRIFAQIATMLGGADIGHLNQPRLFSDGFPHLFLTSPKASYGGVTVRLKSADCNHVADCECAKPGLPEGIVAGGVAFRSSVPRQIRGIFLAFHRDLIRYEPPSCEYIRTVHAL